MKGEASALKPRQMDEYILRPADDGSFECDIFLDQSPQTLGTLTEATAATGTETNVPEVRCSAVL
jgi:hypothetical protein